MTSIKCPVCGYEWLSPLPERDSIGTPCWRCIAAIRKGLDDDRALIREARDAAERARKVRICRGTREN